MISIGIGFQDFDIRMIVGNVMDNALEVVLHTMFEDFPAVFGRNYQVISRIVDAVPLAMDFHAMILPREDSGPDPHPRAYARGIG